MSEDNSSDAKNTKMRCLPCVMPYTEDLENLAQPGTKHKPKPGQCRGSTDNGASCQCTPQRPCCNIEDKDDEKTKD